MREQGADVGECGPLLERLFGDVDEDEEEACDGTEGEVDVEACNGGQMLAGEGITIMGLVGRS